MWVRESNNTTLDLVDRWILNVPEAPPSICKYQSFTYVCLVIVLFKVGGGFLFRCSLLPQNLLLLSRICLYKLQTLGFIYDNPLLNIV